MANVQIACWTMDGADFNGAAAPARADMLDRVAQTADTQLKIAGRIVGGAFTRILVVPEYAFNAGAGGGLLARSAKHALYRRLEAISASLPELVLIAGTIAYGKGLFGRSVYSVCPVLHGGHIVAKLYKADDDGHYQVNGRFRTKRDGGRGTPVVALPGGLTLGLDICLDFSNERLGTYLAANNVAPPDIHVHVSGTNGTFPQYARCKVNGLYVHCDLGTRGANGASAFQVTAQHAVHGAQTTRLQPDVTVPLAQGRLMVFGTQV